MTRVFGFSFQFSVFSFQFIEPQGDRPGPGLASPHRPWRPSWSSWKLKT